MAHFDTIAPPGDAGDMTERQTRNVSLPPHLDEFVNGLVATGRYQTASEVVRDGLRLLELAEHRRLLEKWVYAGLTPDEASRLPEDLLERASHHVHRLIDTALEEVERGQVTDGPSAMKRLRARLEGLPE